MTRMVDLDAVSTEWSEEEEFTAEDLLETALDNCYEAMSDLQSGHVDDDTFCKMANVELAIKELYSIWDI